LNRAENRLFNDKKNHLENREDHIIHHWKHALAHHTNSTIHTNSTSEAIQLDDTKTSDSTTVGVSSVVVTGIVIGATFLFMNKKSAVVADHETSLIDN